MDSLFCIKLIFNFCMDDGAVGGVYEDVIADGSGCDADFIHGVEGVLRHSALRRLAIPIRLARGCWQGDDLFVGLGVCCGGGRSPGSGVCARTSGFHAFRSALFASFIAFAVFVFRLFFAVAFAAVFRTVFGTVHIEEGDFFERQFTFVFAMAWAAAAQAWSSLMREMLCWSAWALVIWAIASTRSA